MVLMTDESQKEIRLGDESGRVAALHRYQVLDTPVEKPFDRITKLVQQILDVPMAAVTLIDSDRQWLKSCVGMERGSTPREYSFCTHTIQSRQPMNVPDATLDERFATNPFVMGEGHIRSYLGVPISTPDGYNVGALCAVDTKPRVFTAEQAAMLASFALLVTDELELRMIAQTDHLTGAMTRRGFLHELEKQTARIGRNERQSALIMLDVDHFKLVNDEYGHGVGDAVLRNLALCIQRNLRKGDTFGRLGGEEFGILLVDCDAVHAFELAERIRRTVADTELADELGLSVRISLGISAHSLLTTPDDWMATADGALYEAKRTGRNRTCIA